MDNSRLTKKLTWHSQVVPSTVSLYLLRFRNSPYCPSLKNTLHRANKGDEIRKRQPRRTFQIKLRMLWIKRFVLKYWWISKWSKKDLSRSCKVAIDSFLFTAMEIKRLYRIYVCMWCHDLLSNEQLKLLKPKICKVFYIVRIFNIHPFWECNSLNLL